MPRTSSLAIARARLAPFQGPSAARGGLSGLARSLSFWKALRAPRYNLWDEARGRLVPFAEA